MKEDRERLEFGKEEGNGCGGRERESLGIGKEEVVGYGGGEVLHWFRWMNRLVVEEEKKWVWKGKK